MLKGTLYIILFLVFSLYIILHSCLLFFCLVRNNIKGSQDWGFINLFLESWDKSQWSYINKARESSKSLEYIEDGVPDSLSNLYLVTKKYVNRDKGIVRPLISWSYYFFNVGILQLSLHVSSVIWAASNYIILDFCSVKAHRCVIVVGLVVRTG